MLGGLAAVKEKEFFKTLTGNFKSVSTLYLLSIIYICGSYYYYYYQYGYDLISLTNTFQQLSPQGFIYTIASILFFCGFFARKKTENYLTRVVDFISDNSMLVYFAHPFWLSMIERISHHLEL